MVGYVSFYICSYWHNACFAWGDSCVVSLSLFGLLVRTGNLGVFCRTEREELRVEERMSK